MEIRNLMTFVTVCELNSFTKAAKALGYSQSTVSFQIKQLEDELSSKLFDRINHRISLTERGRELLEYTQRIRRLTYEFNQEKDSSAPPEGHIHIVTPDSVCEDMMTANYMDFHDRYPGISLRFTTADTPDMFEMLDRNEADIMLTLDNHKSRSEYIVAKEERVDIHFVTGANSEYNCHKALKIKDILDMPFILTERSVSYRRAFDEELTRMGIEITPILEIGRTDIITQMLQRGAGISFLPDFVTRDGVKSGKLAYLNVTDLKVDIWKQLIYHRNKWIPRSLEALINYIKENEFGR